MPIRALRIVPLLVLLAGCKISNPLSTPSKATTGKERHVVIVYLDRSGSMDYASEGESDRSRATRLAAKFVNGLDAQDPSQVALSLVLFSRSIDPESDVNLYGKGGVLEVIQRYGESARSGSGNSPTDPEGTSLVEVLRDAQKRIEAAKSRGAVSFTVLVLTDGGVEDYHGGDIGQVAPEAKKLMGEGGKALTFVIAGITSESGGRYRQILKNDWEAYPDQAKVGKDADDSVIAVDWASERFKATVSPKK